MPVFLFLPFCFTFFPFFCFTFLFYFFLFSVQGRDVPSFGFEWCSDSPVQRGVRTKTKDAEQDGKKSRKKTAKEGSGSYLTLFSVQARAD